MAKEKPEKKWLYSDTATRFAKSNQLMRLCINIMEVILLILFLLQILNSYVARNAFPSSRKQKICIV